MCFPFGGALNKLFITVNPQLALFAAFGEPACVPSELAYEEWIISFPALMPACLPKLTGTRLTDEPNLLEGLFFSLNLGTRLCSSPAWVMFPTWRSFSTSSH